MLKVIDLMALERAFAGAIGGVLVNDQQSGAPFQSSLSAEKRGWSRYSRP